MRVRERWRRKRVPSPAPSAAPTIKPGTSAITKLRSALMRTEQGWAPGGEGVISHLGPRRRNGANERGFPRVGQAQEAHVGDQFKLKAQIAHFPNRSLGGAPWGPVHRAFKHRVTESVAPPAATRRVWPGSVRSPRSSGGFLRRSPSCPRAPSRAHPRLVARSSPGPLAPLRPAFAR